MGKLLINILGSQLTQTLPPAFNEAKHFCHQYRGKLVLNTQNNLVSQVSCKIFFLLYLSSLESLADYSDSCGGEITL